MSSSEAQKSPVHETTDDSTDQPHPQPPGVTVRGLCKFLLLSTGPEFGLYVTPVNIDPEHPVMPVGYPAVYPVYLAKRQGPFATLGLAEDTWALNEQVIGVYDSDTRLLFVVSDQGSFGPAARLTYARHSRG